jgi:hypothetical protein
MQGAWQTAAVGTTREQHTPPYETGANSKHCGTVLHTPTHLRACYYTTAQAAAAGSGVDVKPGGWATPGAAAGAANMFAAAATGMDPCDTAVLQLLQACNTDSGLHKHEVSTLGLMEACHTTYQDQCRLHCHRVTLIGPASLTESHNPLLCHHSMSLLNLLNVTAARTLLCLTQPHEHSHLPPPISSPLQPPDLQQAFRDVQHSTTGQCTDEADVRGAPVHHN